MRGVEISSRIQESRTTVDASCPLFARSALVGMEKGGKGVRVNCTPGEQIWRVARRATVSQKSADFN